MIQVSFTDRDTGKGHLRSCEVISSSLPINHDMMVLKTCKWYQTVSLVKTRRLTCNMTITPAPIGSWPDRDLRSSLNWPMKVIMYIFRIVSTRKTQWCQSHFSIFLVQKLFRLQFLRHVIFDDFWWPQLWPDPIFVCKSCRYLTDLSNAVCRLSLRCLVFEIWRGGGDRIPRPESNLSEPARNRVKLPGHKANRRIGP